MAATMRGKEPYGDELLADLSASLTALERGLNA
jgi:hypothetical protein